MADGGALVFEKTNLNLSSADLEAWRALSTQMPISKGPGSGNLQNNSQLPNNAQWLRRFSLIVYAPSGGSQQNGIELSPNPVTNLRCTFNINKTTNQSPNTLYARIYNLAPATLAKVIAFTRVQVSAGYWFAGFGKIFDGLVVQYRRGKENPVDTYLDIYAGDGDKAFNNSTVNKVIPAGSTDMDKYNEMVKSMQEAQSDLQVPANAPDSLKKDQYQRARSLQGHARDIMRELNLKYNLEMYIDNGTLVVNDKGGYRDGEAVILAPNTGLVGIPEVTPQGIQAKCLLNPKLRLGGLVKIDSNLLSGVPYTPGTSVQTNAQGQIIPGGETGGLITDPNLQTAMFGQQFEEAWTSPTGTYKILLMNYNGDTRGQPWYCDLTCIAIGSNGEVMNQANPSSAWFRASPTVTSGGAVSGPGGG